MCEPLNQCLRKESKWLEDWNDRCRAAFQGLKACLTSESVLHMPDWSRPFCLSTDASDVGIGAVLFQKLDDGREAPIAYHSRALKGSTPNRPASSPPSGGWTVRPPPLPWTVDV